VIEVIKESI